MFVSALACDGTVLFVACVTPRCGAAANGRQTVYMAGDMSTAEADLQRFQALRQVEFQYNQKISELEGELHEHKCVCGGVCGGGVALPHTRSAVYCRAIRHVCGVVGAL